VTTSTRRGARIDMDLAQSLARAARAGATGAGSILICRPLELADLFNVGRRNWEAISVDS
jgi:hypothetical protein